MPPTTASFQTDTNPSPVSLVQRDQQRAVLTSITRQHESAVFTYLYRRVRRSVNVESLTKDVFARLLSMDDLDMTRDMLRKRLVQLCQEVLTDFSQNADPRDAAWTELCLELDALAKQKQAEGSTEPPVKDLSAGANSTADPAE